MNDIYAIPKTEYEAIDRLEELKEYCMDEMLSEKWIWYLGRRYCGDRNCNPIS